MSPIYLGLVGPIASGKGLLSDFLREIGFEYVSLSDQVRLELKKRGLPVTRENMQDVGDEMRKLNGNCYWADMAMCAVQNPNHHLVFDSIRNPGEIRELRSLMNIKILGVDAPVEKRIAWYQERARLRGEDNPDMSVFIEVSLRDRGVNQLPHGQQVDECLKMADIIFQNNGHKEDVIRELSNYLKSEFQFDPELHRRTKEG